MPLKGVPPVISPELLYALASMGHGDEIVLADSNFPSDSVARANGARLIVCDGLPVPKLLRAILKLFPLDQYVDKPVALMDLVDNDKKKGLEVPIWNEYKEIVGNDVQFELVERFEFYERAKKCFAVVRKLFYQILSKWKLFISILGTGESAIYANIILKKGVVVVAGKKAKDEHDTAHE